MNKDARKKLEEQLQQMPLFPLSRIPISRINMADVVLNPIKFYRHCKDCIDGCAGLFFFATLPAYIAPLLAGFSVVMATKGYWGVAILSALLALTTYGLSMFAGRCYAMLDKLRDVEREQLMRSVGGFLGALSGLGKALGIDIVAPQMEGAEAEDPIAKVIRESNELYRNKGKGDGKPPIS